MIPLHEEHKKKNKKSKKRKINEKCMSAKYLICMIAFSDRIQSKSMPDEKKKEEKDAHTHCMPV